MSRVSYNFVKSGFHATLNFRVHYLYKKSPAFLPHLTETIFNVDFLENKTVGFDENLRVALRCDMQQRVILP